MEFDIPANLDRFSVQGLREVATEAAAAHAALLASVTVDTVTDEQLAQLQALKAFIDTANTTLTELTARQTSFADAATVAPVVQETVPAVPATPAPTDGGPEHQHDHSAPAGSALSALRISDLAPEDLKVQHDAPADRPNYGVLIAAADVPGVPAGTPLDMRGFADAFIARASAYAGMGPQSVPISHGVAVIKRDYPAELTVWGDQRDEEILARVTDEKRLPGGSLLNSVSLRYDELGGEKANVSLTAASGWCAPSETIYTICSQITTDGLVDYPEVQARRGGVRHNTGLDFGTIFGDGTGFFNLTEAQVASGTQKTCVEIPCPDFSDDRLGVTGLCLTGNLLAIRGYPEYTATFTQGAMAAHAHQLNALQVAAVATGSTAVSLAAAQPWASDGTVASNLLGAVEMAIVDIKYNLRLQRSATLEVIFPFWVLAQFRADFSRRTGGDSVNNMGVTDAMIMQWFATRGARVQFVYDWQDAFADAVTAGEPGALTPITALPTTTQFLVYPAGTWVRAVSDVITLNSVYDSTLLRTNQVTHLFMETGWKMLKMCPVSRVYTVPTCPSGETTSTQSITCP